MKENNQAMQIGVPVLLAVIIILSNYLSLNKISSNLTNSVTNSILEIEYNKVGGKENYEKINDIQKIQIAEGLKIYDSQGGSGKQKSQENIIKNPDTNISKLSLDKVKSITKDTKYILGNPDAEISFVEYSDLECTYCQKLQQSGTIEKILESYNGKVNYIYKQFPLEFHPKAQMESEAALCVGDLGGNEKYYEFINKVFDNSKVNGNSYTKESISELGSGIGVDKNKLLSCIEDGRFEAQVKAELNEGLTTFGITGTPGNVFINNKTGEWNKLSGAYPYENFKEMIDSLLK